MTRAASPLILGTAQLGLPYGIANRVGQPDYQTAVRIVAAALECGITTFDTAAAYGDSEATLGRALRALDARDRVLVITKIRHLSDEERADPVRGAAVVTESVETSRRRLGLDRLPLVLFHKAADAQQADALEALRARGWIDRTGISLSTTPTAPLHIDPRFTALQTPANLLEPWPRRPAIVASLTRPGLDVFVRSVYLQGLLVMPLSAVPPHLAAILPARRRLAAIAADYGITESELALRYALGLELAAGVVIGVETPEQLRANAGMAQRGPLPRETLARIDAAVAGVPEELLSPVLWPEMARRHERPLDN